ncbi:MAG: acyl-CoA thioesterase [candidate division KSB1 bacterium]|nr:acyl-CoA thioesterase [candidate division KSB1 bacterium]MDZ7274673.1 acyl-CoA thioesterase [candidate division KSB1 bacterium]MDZ7285498.1 acyl-CoA thioesterase [candidate division KSB1 bacterium]MDZ7298530.1 acyl-CoA thioesterase [candidate division KSB1 bacterium]MDZ7306246.1 acyl-CoA thioesterase [candidate division KSB1 bacterium]
MIENNLHLRVRYADTDKMGVAYYANYFKWFEAGRTEMLRATGLPYAEIEQLGVALPVTEACCTYRKPAHYDDLLRIVSRLREFPRASLRIEYEIFNQNDELLASGHTTHVFINADGRPVRPPRIFLQTLRPFFEKTA